MYEKFRPLGASLSAALAVLFCAPLLACEMSNAPSSVLPRNQRLPLFNPHMTSFVCEVEATKVPPIDAQAEAWFLEANSLEDPEILRDERDYKRIVQLTKQAAERKHWKAMLNLASLYIERRDPLKSVEDAIKLVEDGMRLGVPTAYDRMGTYYMNGTGVKQDATRAYAFWQKAALMGSPHAMSFLGGKLDAATDSGNGTYWANTPIARKMLECAFSQGDGAAAYQLSFLLAGNRPPEGSGNRTKEASALALKVLHDGVKFGCEDCANALAIEFGHPFNLADMLAPHVDEARETRYGLLGDALFFDRRLRFPNLDQVLPLPPSPLPPWNGDRDTLINAAIGVKFQPVPPSPSATSLRSGRHHLDAHFKLRQTGHKTSTLLAPQSGFWQPTGHEQPDHIRAQLENIPPALYTTDQPFEHFFDNANRNSIPGVVWERWDTEWHNEAAVEPRAPRGALREVPNTIPLISSRANIACPATGIWQPWLPATHPLRAIVNQHWRQAWLTKGQPFPRPEEDWLLALPASEVTWHLMDDAGTKLL